MNLRDYSEKRRSSAEPADHFEVELIAFIKFYEEKVNEFDEFLGLFLTGEVGVIDHKV